ncbi:MAG: hypothetical protein KDD25_10075, partial [Bdellovibrionales bacterium]|nr:hypothetical protein [Bdellovibrionales bacterium]
GDKQARISRSEGERQEEINVAEGEREAKMRRAEGEAEAIRKVADAKADALKRLSEAIGSKELTTQFLVATNYIEEFGRFVSRPGDKIFVPYESSVALGGFGTVADIMEKKIKSNNP